MRKKSKHKVSREKVILGSGNVFLDLKFSEKEARELQARAQRLVRKSRRLAAQDRGDVSRAKRRRGEVARPYAELRKELRLSKC